MPFRYTQDLRPDFERVFNSMCNRLGAEPLSILSPMFSESGCHAYAHNAGGAVGLIQLEPDNLRHMGWTAGDEAFSRLDAIAQLPYAERFFSAYKGKLTSPARVYVSMFMPVHLSDPDADSTEMCSKVGRYGWAYAANVVLDANGDGVITQGELGEAIARNCHGARWCELVERVTGVAAVDAPPDPFDLRTTRGIQEALLHLGCEPGPLDGIPGRLTTLAVVNFQRQHSLDADGIPGPKTRAAIASELGRPRAA